MLWQSAIVAFLVAWAFAYALWTLSPKPLQQRLRAGLLCLPLPAQLKIRLSSTDTGGGCGGGCSGCAPAAPVKPVAGVRTKVIPICPQRK